MYFTLFIIPMPLYSVHPDIRDLPSIVPEHVANLTAHVVEAELTDRIAKITRMIDAGTYDPEIPNG
jgi:hypothetical protein